MTANSLYITAYFAEPSGLMRWQRAGLPGLPEDLRPTHFGLGEIPVRKPRNAIDNDERFQAFLDVHRSGDFYGDWFLIDTSVHDNIPSRVDISAKVGDDRLERYGRHFFEMWEEYGILYGHGEEFAEERARNGYVQRSASGSISHGWFGRDIRRYVPGLYWLNYFSTDYLDEHPLDVEGLAAELRAQVFPTRRGFVLQLYERPDEWRARSDEVQRVIDKTAGIFSRSCIEVPQGLSVKEELAWGEQIFKQWP